ncbi:hypothetical protein [Piscirickettsia salmonis]
MKHIIAIGGGGFENKVNHRKVELYLIEQTGKENPKICLLP